MDADSLWVLSIYHEATWPVLFVLSVLVLASVLSLAIILDRVIYFWLLQNNSRRFLQGFWSIKNVSDLIRFADGNPKSPYQAMVQLGYRSLEGVERASKDHDDFASTVRRVEREAREASERGLILLATISSSAPFIGLFGTVWGIMHSFRKIGETGSSSLAVVAPGISEALIATAVGLAAAIPAGIAFNLFTRYIRKEAARYREFADELIRRLRKEAA